MSEGVSVVVPVYREGARVVGILDRLRAVVPPEGEILVVYDTTEDPTVPYLTAAAAVDPRLRPLHNTYGRGPANAVRYGIDHTAFDVVVVTMGDGSDQADQIPELAELVRQGATIAAASRYVRGGRQLGGPILKSLLSRIAGLTLHHLAGVPIHDATSSFKAYRKSFVEEVGIESRRGFAVALELVAKAHRLRLPMREIPTIWRERTSGASKFRLLAWLPEYLKWYLFAFGPRISATAMRRRREQTSA